MQASIKYLSTLSGKSIILSINSKSYVFNIFEGFQRYCIEKNISLKYLTTIFIPNEACIPPLCGLYLTLRDMNIKNINIVCTDYLKFRIKSAFQFCPPNQLQIKFVKDDFEDECIKVSGRYILQIKNIRGRFLVENIPKSIPKNYYKDLIDGKGIKIDDIFYDGSNFLEPEINFKKIFILVDELERNIQKDNLVLCFRKKEYNIYKKCIKNIFYLRISQNIDFVSQFNFLVGLNKISKDHHLPCISKKFKLIRHMTIGRYFSRFKNYKSLTSGDHFVYNKNLKDFLLVKEFNKKYRLIQNLYTNNSVLILGSGCAIPSKYRNVSGILIDIEDKKFLFDCGEDTLYQILRYYGSFKILDKLEMIFISHSHGDHSLGIINLIKQLKHKVKILGPKVILNWVSLFYDNFIPLYTDNAKILQAEYTNYGDILNYILIYNFDFIVKVCGSLHNTDSCSISLEYKNIRVSYSGDTRPSFLFATMALYSDVLIHESTFDNDHKDIAIKTSHSTLKEAKNIFNLSKSKNLLLTHFSQRYPKGFISNSLGIPCYDFYNYIIGKSIYKEEDIIEYLQSLN